VETEAENEGPAAQRESLALSDGRDADVPVGVPVPILQVIDLHTSFRTRGGVVPVVRGVSLEVRESSSIGIVGESGSGKSVTAWSIMRLVQFPGFIKSGRILLRGRDLARLSEKDMTKVRGREMGMVFQEPLAALNPVYAVGWQVAEAVTAHQRVSRAQAMERAADLFDMVGIRDKGRVLRQFPHQLSGGMAQRVTIAIALANDPSLLILDEPTTALDTTIQAQVLDVVRSLQSRVSAALVLVTHDIAVVSEMCEEVAVMYGGRVMESGLTDMVIENPKHPYTVGLVSAAISVTEPTGRLRAIPGEVVSPDRMPPGCPFAPRCPDAMEQCTVTPEVKTLADGRKVACWLF
jgi:oligopeptide/dipeptide ABC transporter ATP-binding protein